ncbi:MAG: NADH-quinone oxidoreductase subunit C [Vulcanimicrobiaceae bacterium]
MIDAGEAAVRTRERIRSGARLAWIAGDASDVGTVLHYVVADDFGLSVCSGTVAGDVPSLSPECAVARWHERELRDRFGVEFVGLDDSRSLVEVPNAEDLLGIVSPEVSTVLYGPIRSGIVEPARWLVESAGEDFIAVYPSMFFKRRFLEERFVGVPLDQAPFVAEHANGATAASHATAFCRAVERALDIQIPSRAQAAREALVEFERIHQHLDSLAKLAEDGSLSVGTAQTLAAKERIHRLLAAATGSRFARGVIAVGGTRFDALGRLQAQAAIDLDAIESETLGVVEALFGTQSLLDRLIGTGRLSRETVVAYGGVGPVARGSGISCDARLTDGYQLAPLADCESLERNGDAVARAHVRRAEIRVSFRLIRAVLGGTHPQRYREPVDPVVSQGFGRVESPQGELVYFVRLDPTLARVALRSASYANWPLFVPSLPGNIFTDFSFIEHSFGLAQAEVDR